MHSATAFGTNRSVCATVRGDLGRVPFGTEPDDLVCVMKGGIVPYLLRRRKKKDECYALVGECFVNGIMYGECLARRDLVERESRIV